MRQKWADYNPDSASLRKSITEFEREFISNSKTLRNVDFVLVDGKEIDIRYFSIFREGCSDSYYGLDTISRLSSPDVDYWLKKTRTLLVTLERYVETVRFFYRQIAIEAITIGDGSIIIDSVNTQPPVNTLLSVRVRPMSFVA